MCNVQSGKQLRFNIFTSIILRLSKMECIGQALVSIAMRVKASVCLTSNNKNNTRVGWTKKERKEKIHSMFVQTQRHQAAVTQSGPPIGELWSYDYSPMDVKPSFRCTKTAMYRATQHSVTMTERLAKVLRISDHHGMYTLWQA